jgi:imipenem/basic amino acid-specific outer membrane pore
MRYLKLSAILIASMGIASMAQASDQSDSKGFVEDSHLDVLNRTMYMNRDFRNGGSNSAGTTSAKGERKGYREEAANGTLVTYQSGFTQGTFGLGVDAIGMLGIKIDGGGGRAGNGLMPVGDSGEPADSYSSGGAAVKLRFSNTVIKYGNQFVATPVFDTGDSRLLPEVATGLLVTSNEIKDLTLTGGHFTAIKDQAGQGRDSLVWDGAGHTLKKADFVGANYNFTKNFTGQIYASDVQDYWKKQYVNLNYLMTLSDNQSLNFDFNAYRTEDTGDKIAGDIDSKIFSAQVAYAVGPHKFTIARQQNTGKGGYQYGIDGGDSVYLNNSVQYSDFNHEDEKSWQVRYDLKMAAYGVPGLSFMGRYVTSDDIKVRSGDEVTDNNGKAWERNLEAKYVVQAGPAKDLSFRVRQASYRSSALEDNIDEVRVIVEYPLSIL